MARKRKRKRITGETIVGRFPPGTKARLAKVRRPRETQSNQLREGVDLVLQVREQPQQFMTDDQMQKHLAGVLSKRSKDISK